MSTQPAEPDHQDSSPRTGIIGRNYLIAAGVVILICCLLPVLAFFVMRDSIADSGFRMECSVNFSGDDQLCNQWLDDIKANHSEVYEQCKRESPVLPYACIVNNGLMPPDQP
jgi:hypothetical protein